MKVLVLGAGVIGVSTAYYLAKSGHEVTVLDRREGPGLETSFANGGQVVPSHAEPWAGPGTPALMLRWMFRADAPLLFRPRAEPQFWAWALRFLANCSAARARANTARNLRLGFYSLEALAALRAETGLDYDHAGGGSLHVFRDARAFDAAARHAGEMREMGCVQEAADRRRCLEIEPALAGARVEIAGGIFCPADEAGDTHKFTAGLAGIAAGLGVEFRYGANFLGFIRERGKIACAATDSGPLTADAYVLALASFSARPARRLGLKLPVYPVKGYSATLAVGRPEAAPRIGITDDAHRIVMVRLGDRLRIAGTAEIAGYDNRPNPVRLDAMLRAAAELYPEAGDYARAEPWSGLRPVTPDNVPVIGPTRYANLFVNTGHGVLGWTHACGSARVLADLISGHKPDIDLEGLTIDRF